MKKLIIILLSAISLTAFAQSEKTVAVLEPICRDKSVKPFYQLLIRGEMESAVTATDEYISFDRTAFDKITEEQKFQRSGAVNDSQIKRLGEIAGVDYILVTEVSADEGYITCIAKILHVETGHSTKSYNELMELNAPSVKNGCRSLTAKLFGLIDMNTGQRKGELLLEEGKYIGEIKNGKPHGNGKLLYKSSDDKYSLYEGSWQEGKKQGLGKLVLKDGTSYEGQFENDDVNGKGTAYYANGAIEYVGEYKDGVPHGEGVFFVENGDKLEGHWENGNAGGYGTYYFVDGRKYVGNFENNTYNGKGTFYFVNGEKYVGNFTNGEMHGQGIYYFSDGNRYEGNFENGWINGYGTAYYSDGGKHVGYYKDGNRHGPGTIYFEGGRFEGNFRDDKAEGIGVFYYSVDNSEEKGNIVNGQKDGIWIRTDSNGKTKKATYSNGELIRDWH